MFSDYLKNYTNANAIDAIYAIPDHETTPEIARIARIATLPASETALLSHWWLLDLDNGDALQVCSYPYSNKSQILNHYPYAIAAKPMACQVSNESIVDAGELLRQMHEASFTVTLIGDVIDVQPLHWIDVELAMLIKTHEQGLIDLLEINYE